MIIQSGKRIARAAIVAASCLLPVTAWAVDEVTRAIVDYSRDVEGLQTIGNALKEVLTPEIGFPEDHVALWHEAVYAAFAPELLEADLLTALDARLTEETRAAALSFVASDYGRTSHAAVLDESNRLHNPEDMAKVRAYVEAASREEADLYVRFFAAQTGKQRADLVMDVYFRLMVVAATPVVGEGKAREWVRSSGQLREGYTDEYFLSTVSTYRALPLSQFAGLVAEAERPEMLALAKQVTDAFSVALNAAADRLEHEYGEKKPE